MGGASVAAESNNNPSSSSSSRILRTESSDSAGGQTRILPRGTIFESSRRMETADVYTPGSGLIKLSDGSGWAIVPRRDDLDAQYRTHSGAAAATKQGEAMRAYEEVGNAVLTVPAGLHLPMGGADSAWLRIVRRGGVFVSCPPPTGDADGQGNNAATSPGSASSAATAPDSAVGRGQQHPGLGSIPSQESSDVASSVGSSFLEAMFRTPRKRDGGGAGGSNGKDKERRRNEQQQDPKESQSAQLRANPPVNPVLPCGLCVEVDRWEDSGTLSHHSGRRQVS